ncbi:RNA polymerase sigma factor sigma-70 region 4 domain-containing protein [Secundilactobacillus muriivasis]
MNEQLDVAATKASAVDILVGSRVTDQDDTAALVNAFSGNGKKTDIDTAFDYLSSDEQRVLRSRFVAGKSVEDVSHSTGISVENLNAMTGKALMAFMHHYQGGAKRVYIPEN